MGGRILCAGLSDTLNIHFFDGLHDLMRLLTHHQLDTQRVRAQFSKLQQAVARDDFKSPNLKKL